MTQKKQARSREQTASANRTRARPQKEKHHKSAPKRRDNRKRGIDLDFLQEKKLRDEDVPHAKSLFLKAWERTGYISEACKAAGIGRRTYYQWITTDPDFRAQAKESRKVWRAAAIPDLETSMQERGALKDTLSGIFLLKHNTKRYREVNRVQLSGPDGGPIVTIDAKEQLIDRLEKLIAKSQEKPLLAVGDGVEVREVGDGKGLKVVKGQRGLGVRKVKGGVSYG